MQIIQSEKKQYLSVSKGDHWVYHRLKELICNDQSLLQASICLEVRPARLKNILEEKPVSRYVWNKLVHNLDGRAPLRQLLWQVPRVQKMMKIYHLYRKFASLAEVSKRMGLSRERIRQLLKKGTELGLFKYERTNFTPLPEVPKVKLLSDYKQVLRITEVARMNHLTGSQLSRLRKLYRIGREEFHQIYRETRKEKCVLEYDALFKSLGYHPSTTEMQKSREGCSLSYRIVRLWGSIDSFRKSNHINNPPRRKNRIILLVSD